MHPLKYDYCFNFITTLIRLNKLRIAIFVHSAHKYIKHLATKRMILHTNAIYFRLMSTIFGYDTNAIGVDSLKL